MNEAAPTPEDVKVRASIVPPALEPIHETDAEPGAANVRDSIEPATKEAAPMPALESVLDSIFADAKDADAIPEDVNVRDSMPATAPLKIASSVISLSAFEPGHFQYVRFRVLRK